MVCVNGSSGVYFFAKKNFHQLMELMEVKE